MIALRIIAVFLALAIISFGSARMAQGRMRRFDFVVLSLISLGIGSLAAYPAMFAPVFDALNVTRGGNRQLLASLVISNFVLFLLYLRAATLASSAHEDIDRLVSALAQREFRAQPTDALRHADVVVVIPAYNEASIIEEVLKEVPSAIGEEKVAPLVVVDGCTDETETIARGFAGTAVHAINRGQGAALLTGYRLVQETGAKVIVVTDADGQTDLSELPRLVTPILNGEADFVNGSRALGSYERDSLIRALGVKVFSVIASVLTGKRVTDVSSPFRAFRADAVKLLELRQPQFQASELLVEAIRKGLRYKEVPITMRRRKHGASKKPNAVRYGWGFARAILQAWMR